MVYVFYVIGFILRFLLIPMAGFKADMAFWKGWGLAMADKGILWLADNTNYNYPPGFAYVLWVVNKVYALFKNPYNIHEYWLDSNVLYLFLIKLVAIVSDLVIVYLIIKIAKKLKYSSGPILGLFFFLSPAVILDSAVWGQVDQFGICLFLLSFYCLFLKKPKLAAVIFTIGVLMKFQNIIFIPLFFLYIYKEYSFEEMVKSGLAAFTTFTIVIFPFWFHQEIGSLIRLLTINSDWFPWYSLNAFNFWWVASGLNGMQMQDKTLFLGIMNAKQVGLYLFSFVYFFACIYLFFSKKEELLKKYLLSCALAVFAFFNLLTQSHERYLFPLLALLPIIFIFESASKKVVKTKNIVFFSLLSLTIFLNMYIALWFNYPDQAPWPFSFALTHSLTFYLSLFEIILFLVFIYIYFFELIKKYWYILAGATLILLSILVFKNLPYILNQPINLTQIQPIYSHQDYLEPVYNMTVESARGPFSWNRLSDNYYFYEKGIGSHANSVITYALGKRFSKFTTDFGLDTEAGSSSKVYFSVEGDGRELFRSKEMGRFDNPAHTVINIKGIDKLTLKINQVGNSISGDHADWLDPVLIK